MNRDGLLTSDVAQQFSAGVLEQAGGLIPNDHFTVVGRPSRAWDS